ncbi:hypothetical protein GCM10025768_08230 [Microbacterium pseudoresistens]|uniref:Uncharacterized protein n=2 Tax=Microbacterium pseudoresistens TaxID=640634 RepID=A0A7Y9EVD7_9MICO|nr:hypothetical protein [Microbacterium pseudoresistens]
MTLAAWNDSEYGAASFQAGTFDIVGSTDGSTFADHATAGAAAGLVFQLAAPTNMMPGTVTHALFSVKNQGSVDGHVQLVVDSSSGTLSPYLTYGVRLIAGTACNATTYAAGAAVIGDGTALSAGSSNTQGLAAGATVNYCFAVTLPATAGNGAQGGTLSQVWRVAGESGAG